MKTNKNEKTLRQVFGTLFTILLITFLTLYISQATGYYEYTAHKKASYTSEQIKKFEQDLKDGKDVTLEDYLKDQEKDYSNKVSRFGYHLSTTIGKYVKGFLENTFKTINDWIEE